VELARTLGADVLDDRFMVERASTLARAVGRGLGLPAGQVAEAFLRRKRYEAIVAWADRLGLPLALLFKLGCSRRDSVMISVWLSSVRKAFMLERLRVHSHLGAIVGYGTRQLEIAADRLGVPRQKLHLALQPVDDRFWRPDGNLAENMICAVGSEQRDYPTLLRAAAGLDLNVHVAIGTTVASPAAPTDNSKETLLEVPGAAPVKNVRVCQLDPESLRALYRRSRFVVIPLKDVDYDAGVTVAVEAMAMAKAVIITRTRGQIDVIRDGVEGICVPPGEPSELRAAIEHLSSHPEEAARMGRAGRARVEDRHTLDAYVARLAEIVRSLNETVGNSPATLLTSPLGESTVPATLLERSA
jgi:glycosyltransferase involved in cell wall biosynthesis